MSQGRVGGVERWLTELVTVSMTSSASSSQVCVSLYAKSSVPRWAMEGRNGEGVGAYDVLRRGNK